MICQLSVVSCSLNPTALPDVMRYKNPTPNPLQYQKLILFFPPLRGDLGGCDEGAKMHLIRAETAVIIQQGDFLRDSGFW